MTYRRETADSSLRALDIDDLKLLLEPEALRKQVQLAWVNELQGSFPVTGESVRQVILNLLINACAATPEGGAVRLRAYATESALTIEVGDQGAGLPADLAKYLVGQSEDAPGVGRGLGLWIVRRLVAVQGGAIRVAREGGFSTLIRVTWPFQQDFSRLESRQDPVHVEAIHAE